MTTHTAPRVDTVATSSTGTLHRAYIHEGKYGNLYSAKCASATRVGSKAVYLRGGHEFNDNDRASANLCQRCFGAGE